MRKFKVLFMDHAPFIGGAQLALLRHLRYLDRSHFAPAVFCSSSVPELLKKFQQAGAKVFAVPFGQLKVFSLVAVGRFLAVTWRLGRAAYREKVDLIVTNSERAFYPALLVSFMLRKKLILWVRDFEYPRFLLKAFGGQVSKFVFVSRAVRDYYSFAASPKACVVYVGTDLFGSDGFNRPDGSILDPSGLKGPVTIGFAGRLVSWKGAMTLLSAVSLLKKLRPPEGPTFKVIIAGESCGQEGENADELKAYVRQQGLEGMVDFVGFLQNMALFYKSLDIFVHPSLKPEPFATVVVEAMAAGLPVIAAAAGGTLEVIKDGENGLFFPLGDAVTLAEKLKRLLSEGALRRQLGTAAQRTIQQSLTEEGVTQRMEQIYKEVLGK